MSTDPTLDEPASKFQFAATADGQLHVRRLTDDGAVHRVVYAPGDVLDHEDPEVRAKAEETWTPEVVAAYHAAHPPAAIDAADVIRVLRRVVQAHLDAAAQAREYDSIYTACSYAEESAVPRFQSEGRAFRRWRSLVWARCLELLDDAQKETRPLPTPEELIALLPAPELPTRQES